MNLPSHIGHYDILGLLGTGGMAEVFLGRFRGAALDERPVVVKRILPHLARQQHFVDMFRDEAQIAARIHHPNVVEVHELGKDGHELYLVMEYLAGESAAAIAKQLAHRKKLLSFGLCAHLMAEVCAGLHAAHNLVDDQGEPLNIVHRDVSPANIFVTYDGEVKVLDFGIAVAANRLSKTAAGQVKGKYAYMSPEQCRGKTLDRRSDVFSLGTVLYELSTCRRLFKRPSDMETLEAVCNEETLPPSRLVKQYPDGLERICLKALAKDPEDRYATAMEMRRELLTLADALNKEKQPQPALAKVMRKLFAERIEQKTEMLEQVKAGEEMPASSMSTEVHALELPPVPIELKLELPTEDGEDAFAERAAALAEPLPFSRPGSEPITDSSEEVSSTNASVGPPVAARSPVAMALLLLVPLAVGVVAGALWTSGSSSKSPAQIARPASVRIELDTEPSFAQVFREGRSLGQTPLSLTLPRGDTAIELTIRKDGFVELVHRLVPEDNQELRLKLHAVPAEGDVSALP